MVCQHLSYDMVSCLRDMLIAIQALHGRQFFIFLPILLAKVLYAFSGWGWNYWRMRWAIQNPASSMTWWARQKALKVDAGPHTLQHDRKRALLRHEELQCSQLCMFKFPCTCTNAIFLLTMQDTWNNKGSSLFFLMGCISHADTPSKLDILGNSMSLRRFLQGGLPGILEGAKTKWGL